MNHNQFKFCQDFGSNIVELFDNTDILFRSIFDSYRRTSRFVEAIFSVDDSNKVTNILEIGTFTGITSTFLALNFPNATVTTFDIASKVLNYTDNDRRKIWNRFNVLDRIRPFVCPNDKKKELIKEYAPYDFVFVDGDHSYDGVLFDYISLFGNLSSNAIIVFDDTFNPGLGVDKFVEEFIPVEAIISNCEHQVIISNKILKF